jgi:leader peptidase (prepilin peptidase)/N-methyltransferase
MGRRFRMISAIGLSAIPVVASAAWWPTATSGIATVISMSWISGAAVFDRLCRRLPDALLALGGLAVVMAAAVHLLHGNSVAVASVGRSAAVWSFPFLVTHLVAPTALGFGDVKAAAVIGAALGLTLPVIASVAAMIVGMAAAASVGMASRRPTIALGPYLALGAIASLTFDRFAGAVA